VFRDISRVRFGSVSYNASLAHFWTGNNNQFNFYHNGNHPCVELNDEYIQNMIDNSTPDVDLSDYYTKKEIDNLLANLPTGGDLPNGEGVEF
jgi:hypothetical protein